MRKGDRPRPRIRLWGLAGTFLLVMIVLVGWSLLFPALEEKVYKLLREKGTEGNPEAYNLLDPSSWAYLGIELDRASVTMDDLQWLASQEQGFNDDFADAVHDLLIPLSYPGAASFEEIVQKLMTSIRQLLHDSPITKLVNTLATAMQENLGIPEDQAGEQARERVARFIAIFYADFKNLYLMRKVLKAFGPMSVIAITELYNIYQNEQYSRFPSITKDCADIQISSPVYCLIYELYHGVNEDEEDGSE